MVYPTTKLWFYPLCWILTKSIKGAENIPGKMPFIIVTNHERTLLDALIIIYPILKKSNKKVHFLAHTGWWFLGETICRDWAGCVPLFDPKNPKQAYKELKKLINSGEIIGIFPEGDIKKTKKPKTGAIRLAIETKTPILPIGLKSSWIPFSSTLNIGKPIYFKNENNLDNQIKDLMQLIYKLRKIG